MVRLTTFTTWSWKYHWYVPVSPDSTRRPDLVFSTEEHSPSMLVAAPTSPNVGNCLLTLSPPSAVSVVLTLASMASVFGNSVQEPLDARLRGGGGEMPATGLFATTALVVTVVPETLTVQFEEVL
jgi:hypothetical protein